MRGRFVAVLAALSVAITASCGGDDDTSGAQSAATDSGAGSADTTEAPAGTGGSDEPAATATPGSGGEGGEGADECTAERVGGELVAMTGAPMSGLDPTMLVGSGARGGDIATAFYGTVVWYDATSDTYEPAIAESWSSNDDESVWTLNLRDDVTFGNGDPFTADDVAAHIERMKTTSQWAGALARLVADTNVVNDHELVVTLESRYNFPYMMSTPVGWVPNNDLVTQRGDGFNANPVGAGAGPYEFQSISAATGESLVLERKADWWGGEVCLDQIDFRYAAEIDTQTDAFLNGEVDTLFVNNQIQAADIEEEGLLAYQIPVGSMGYVTANQGFDGEKTKFDDVRIREALQLAIDYDVLHERLFDGRGPAPTSALMPEESSLYTGIEGPPYDPERARQLVQETIDEGVWDGSFAFLHSATQDQTETAVLLQGMWEAVGMDVTLDAAPPQESLKRIVIDHTFEVASLGFGITPPEPWATMNSLECDPARTRSGFCDPEMEEALEAVKVAVTLDEKRAAMAEVQRVWNRTFPLAMYRHGTFGYAAQPYVHGLEFGSQYTASFENAWIEQ